MEKPSWTDEEIAYAFMEIASEKGEVDAEGIMDVIKKMRDELTDTINELRETLAFAAQYKGIEARGCPLCRYEDGKFIEACQMHKDMDAQRLQLIGLQTEYDRLNSLQSSTLLESQQKDWQIAELRQQLEAQAGWEDVQFGQLSTPQQRVLCRSLPVEGVRLQQRKAGRDE